MGVGTGGTLIGVGQAFREVNPEVRIVALEPSESCTIQCGDTGLHRIEGIADGFIPTIYERHQSLVDQVVAVHSDDAIAEMRRLASEHGLFVGPSSGAVSYTHLDVYKRQVCGLVIDRDLNAAINLARWQPKETSEVSLLDPTPALLPSTA